MYPRGRLGLPLVEPEFGCRFRPVEQRAGGEVASAWVVTKPTEDGVVTSLELFDVHGEAIATLFGRRMPGLPEDPAWRALAHRLA